MLLRVYIYAYFVPLKRDWGIEIQTSLSLLPGMQKLVEIQQESQSSNYFYH